MARASSSNTKFASVNLNKSYGKPAAASTSGSLSSGNAPLGGAVGGRTRASSGMLLLSRPVRPLQQQPVGGGAGAANVPPKSGKVIVPRPVNLPSLRREHAGNDPTIALVGGTGASGWTKTQQQEELPSAAALPETTTSGMARLVPALSVGSTWGTSSSSGHTAAGSLSGDQWPVPNQAAATGTNQAPAVRSGVYTPPSARTMQAPPPSVSGHVVPTVEKAVVLRGEDFPTLQAALPPPPVPPQQRQKELHQKQREKQQELKDQQMRLQQLSEQHTVLKPDEVPQSELGGPQLQPAQPLSAQAKSDQTPRLLKEEMQPLEQQVSTSTGLSGRTTMKADHQSYGPPSPGLRQRRQSNWTDDERDSVPTFRPQGGSYPEWGDRSESEPESRHASRGGDDFGYGRPPPPREAQHSFAPPNRDVEGRNGVENAFGQESVNSGGFGGDHGFNRGPNTGREGNFNREAGFREWGGSGNRDTSFVNRGFSREGNRDFGSSREFGSRDSFQERQGFGSRDGGINRDAHPNRDGGFKGNFQGRDNRRVQGGEYEGGRGRFSDRFMRNGGPGGFSGGRGFSGPEQAGEYGREKRAYGSFHNDGPYVRNYGEIHGLESFRPAQGVGLDPPMIPLLGLRRKKDEAKESNFRDAEREAFEAELERVQKAQELDRQRKLEEKERAVEMAQKEIEERERQARDEEERQAKLEEEAKEAAAKAEREALEAAQKVEEERKAREDEKRHMQQEEERRKDSARRKLQELEEKIAKREAEKKQQDEARQSEDGAVVNVWRTRQEEEGRRQDEAQREEEEKLVASITGTDLDDDDRAPLRPSQSGNFPQRSSEDDIPRRVDSPEVQHITREASAWVPDFRGNTPTELERRNYALWRRDHLADNGNGSGQPLAFPTYSRDNNADFEASVSRDRVYNSRGYGDRLENFYSGGSNNVGFTPEGGSGEYPRRPHFGDRRWTAEDSGLSNKQAGSTRATTPDFDSGYFESSGDREDRRWGRDRGDRWRSVRDGPAQRLSPPRTPPYFQGSDMVEPSPYGRLRHSLAKQPRVPPPPVRMVPQRPLARNTEEQTFLASSQTKNGECREVSMQEETTVASIGDVLAQEDSKDQQSESSGSTRPGADVPQEEVIVLQSKGWGPTQRDWQQVSSQSVREQHSFSQLSQASTCEDTKLQPPTASQEMSSHSCEEDSPPHVDPHPGGESEEKEAAVSLIVGESDRQDTEVLSIDPDFEEEADQGQTDEEEDDDGQEGDEEGYEGYDEEDDDDDDDEDEGDEGDEEARGLPEQHIDKAEIGNETSENEVFTVADFDKRITEAGGQVHTEGDLNERLLYKAVENEYAEPSKKNEEMGGRRMVQEVGEQSLRPSTTGSTTESDAYDVRHSSSSQSHQPLSFVAFSMPQANIIPVSSSQLSSVPLPGHPNSTESPVTLQFGLLSNSSLVQGSVPAIQIGSIQMPLHVPPYIGLQQVTHMSPTQPPMFQFGQLTHHTNLSQLVPTFGQQSQVVNAQTESQAQVADTQESPQQKSESMAQETTPQEGKDPILLQPQAPWLNQFPSVDAQASLEADGRENRFVSAKNSQRPDRRQRDRGVLGEGLNGTIGQEKFPRIKSVRRESGTQRVSQEASAFQANDIGATSQGPSVDGSVLDPAARGTFLGARGRGTGSRGGHMTARGNPRSGISHSGRVASQSSVEGISTSSGMMSHNVGGTRPSRRSNFRWTEFKGRDTGVDRMSSTLGADKPYKQTASGSSELASTAATSGDAREVGAQIQDRGQSGDPSHTLQAGEGHSSVRAGPRPERTYSSEGLQKQGGRGSGTTGGFGRSAEGLLGKYSSEVAPDAPIQSGVVHVFKQPGIEASDQGEFIEVRSKRQMLNDRREQREKEIKAKSKDMKAKEQAARKQRSSAKLGSQLEGSTGNSSIIGAVSERRVPSKSTDNVGNTTRVSQPGTPPSGTVSTAATAAQQILPLAPIGTPASGSTDKRVKISKSSGSNSASGGSLGDGEIGAVTATSESQSVPQESMSGTSIAWGGNRSTRQVVSLTQIQLEEAMKPARYEAPLPQQLPLGERGSMVLDPGTTVASMAGKDKLSGSATGPIGSLLAGEKIQFGAVTSPLSLSNSRPHTPALMNAVGSSLGSRAETASDDADLKKTKRTSGSGLDVPSFPAKGKRTRGDEEMSVLEGGIDPEAEAEAAASAVAVAAISSDESVGSTREPTISMRSTNLKNSFGSVASTTNQSSNYSAFPSRTASKKIVSNRSNSSISCLQSHCFPFNDSGLGLGSGMPVHLQSPMMEDSMAAALPADLSVEPPLSLRGSPGAGSSLLSNSGQLPFSGLEMSQMLGGQIFPFGPTKEVSGHQGSNDQGISSVGPSGGGWQPQHSSVDSYYGGPPPSGFTGQFINPGGAIAPPHMLVYTNPFAQVSQFGQLGFMSPTYLPSGKQPDWKHTPVWSSGPGVVGMSSSDSLGGMMGGQRGSGNIQRMAPGPAVMPVAPPPGPFDLNLSAPFQIPGADSSIPSQWTHVPSQLHSVPISMGFAMQQSRRAPQMMESSGGFNLSHNTNQVGSGSFSSMDAAAQFPDELGLGDTSSSVPSSSSQYSGQRNSGRGLVSNQPAPMSSPGNNKLRSNRRSSRVSRGGNGNGSTAGTVNPGISGNSGAYGNSGANGGRVPPNHIQSQAQLQQQQGLGGMGQPHSHHQMNYSDQRVPSQQNSPRVGTANNWSMSQAHRKGGGTQGRPPIGERGSSGEKIFAPPSKLKQVYVAKPTSSPRSSSGDTGTSMFNGTEGSQATISL